MSVTIERSSTAPRFRLAATGAAVGTGLALWVIAVPIAGVTLRGPAGPGSTTLQPVTLPAVLVMSLASALAGWTLLAVLERLTARARRIWTIVAWAVLVLSLGGPLLGAGVPLSSRITLAAMHLGVGGVLLALLPRSSSTR